MRDADGPVAIAAKDSQRTQTTAATTPVVSVVSGLCDAPARPAAVSPWLSGAMVSLGCAAAEG